MRRIRQVRYMVLAGALYLGVVAEDKLFRAKEALKWLWYAVAVYLCIVLSCEELVGSLRRLKSDDNVDDEDKEEGPREELKEPNDGKSRSKERGKKDKKKFK